jgi:DNA polymerase III epsilon subunit-like protein
MTRLVFLDTETTSLDDERGEVWEIAAIVRQPGQVDAEHLWEIRPTLADPDPMSLKINRYYERRILDVHAPGEATELVSPMLALTKDAPPAFTGAARVALKLAEHLSGAVVIGSYPDFDRRFLRPFLARYNEAWTAHYHPVDIQSMAAGWLYGKAATLAGQKVPGPDWRAAAAETARLPWRSGMLYRALNVDPDRFEAHTALGDARLVRAVYDAITGGA